MIKSRNFWLAAILLAAVPFIMMDVPKHYVDWTREVHDEMIDVVQGTYTYTRTQKANILDNILNSNQSLMAMMYLKSLVSILLLATSIYLFRRYKIQEKPSVWKASGLAVLLFAGSFGVKLLLWTSFSGDADVKLLNLSANDTTLQRIYNNHFKGKVLYVDFWGTTCGPCLEEFRNFTKPLKAKYHSQKDIAYLYICGGRKLVWKQQLERYNIAGSHIFLNEKQYEGVFKNAIKSSNNKQIAMPRYIIINKQGTIVNADAPRPSDTASITAQLNKYLATNSIP